MRQTGRPVLFERWYIMADEHICEDCEVSSQTTKLTKYTDREQEYPGAYVWTFDYYLCKSCAKARPAQSMPTIQENTRGW